jgi:hypothetical protein
VAKCSKCGAAVWRWNFTTFTRKGVEKVLSVCKLCTGGIELEGSNQTQAQIALGATRLGPTDEYKEQHAIVDKQPKVSKKRKNKVCI